MTVMGLNVGDFLNDLITVLDRIATAVERIAAYHEEG